MEGWIKLHRQIMESDGYFSEPFCRNAAWTDLLLLANHANKYFMVRGVKVQVNRGQVGYTEESLASRWKWSRGKVRRFLKHLENEHQIVQQKSRVTTLISILNYNFYQGDGTTDDTTDGTTNGHETVQQTDTNKNDNNEKNEKNTISLNFSFAEFWNLYDKKVGSVEKLEKKWVKLKADERAAIMEYIPRYKKYQPDKKYRKNPDTFFNQRGWEHEIIGEIKQQTIFTPTQNNSWF